MTKPLDAEILKDLSSTFHVSDDNCEHYNKVYNERILPRIKKNYLAHLIAAIEELINDNRQKTQEMDPEDISNWNTRGFFIGLHQKEPSPGKNAETIFFEKKSVCIIYKKIDDKKIDEIKKIRIFIAHELGHVIREHGIIPGTGLIENYANLFAYFAIKGKNDFYKIGVRDLVYKNEKEIIESIGKLCPIHDVRQTDSKTRDYNSEP